MKPCWIIDAYNVIHRIGRFRSRLTSDPDGCRNALVHAVRSFLRNGSGTGIVVFDGASTGDSAPRSSGSLEVVFAKPPRSADDAIKGIIDLKKNCSALTVVSSDMEVYRYAKASGCKVMTSEEFESRLRLPPGSTSQKENPDLSPSEMKDWLDLFK